VVNALRGWLGADKNLALPTHTYCYPNENGQREIFDPIITESVIGAITNYFWHLPGVARSLHPTHSLAVLGPRKQELTSAHEECDTPCGVGTPYNRLIENDAAVLMFGATMDAYTLFHSAEDAARVPYLYEAVLYELFVKGSDGRRVTVRMWRQDMKVPRRFTEIAPWLEQRGALTRRRLGMGELLFIPSSKRVHELITAEMRKDPYFLVAVEAKPEVAKRFEKHATIC
jgi:aminoglycoside 3-N-acetyltransferase